MIQQRFQIALPFLLALLLSAGLCATATDVEPVAIVASGNCGADVAWELDSEGTLTVSGHGPMDHMYLSWDSYQDQIQSVIIYDGVTHIAEEAFAYCRNLADVTIPSSVTSIGAMAFIMCDSLRFVQIPSGVTMIGELAFAWCNDLTSVVIPKSVVSIGDGAFASQNMLLAEVSTENPIFMSIDGILFETMDDGSLKLHQYPAQKRDVSYDIPTSVTEIGKFAFSHCANLKSVSLPGNLSSIGHRAFESAGLISATIDEGVTTLGSAMFYGCDKLSRVTIPQSVTQIDDEAFYACDALEDIYYVGSERDWSAIKFSEGNDALLSATIHFNAPSVWHTVHFETTDAQFGAFGSQRVKDGETAIMPPVPEFEGYTFKGWYLGGQPYDFTVPVTRDITLIGVWEATKPDAPLYNRPIIRVSNVEALPGSTVRLSISLENNPGIISMSLFISYDERLSLEDVDASRLEGDVTFSEDKTCNPYAIVWMDALTNANYTYEGEIITLAFKVDERSAEGFYSVAVHSDDDIFNTDLKTVAFETVDGGIYVAESADTETYTVQFSANGGYVAPEDASKAVVNGRTYGQLPVAQGNGIFAGWFTEASGGIEITSETRVNLTANQTLYAHWSPLPVMPPTITTSEACNIGKRTAVLPCKLEHNGGDPLVKIEFIYWNKLDAVQYVATVDKADAFSVEVSNLSPDSDYYFYAKASNSAGEGLGNICSFHTESVTEPMSISLSPTYLSLSPGDSFQLLPTILPASADNQGILWSSSDESVVRVNDGKLEAVGAGDARVIATTEVKRLTATCVVQVASQPDITGAFDFSEWNMVSNTGAHADYGFDINTATEGGNFIIATAYLARWNGAVMEENDAYPRTFGNVADFYQRRDSDIHVQEALWIPPRKTILQSSTETDAAVLADTDAAYLDGTSDNSEIKSAIMTYGAVYESFVVYQPYFNADKSSYYYPPQGRADNGGHAVTVVGWDDNYDASNFRIKPPANGAFLCKNSWGTGSGTDGYFYVSYYDRYFGKRNGGAVFPSVERKTNYNTIYQYDTLGPCSALEFQNSAYAANVFPQKGNTLNQDELLRAVSFYTKDKNTSYEIYIVTDYKDSTSLSAKGAAIASGSIRDMGYHTVKLEKSVPLNKGTRFAVIVRLSLHAGTSGIYYEYPLEGYSSKARANPDESYYSMNGMDWVDLTTKISNANFCVKAFADNGRASLSGTLFGAVDNAGRAYASEKVYAPQEALSKGIPVNEAFLSWLEMHQTESASLLDSDNHATGEIPSVVSAGENTISFIEGAVLPSQYDLREEQCVSPVKDQGTWSSCWTFATYGSLESCLLKKSKLTSLSGLDGTSVLDRLADVEQNGVKIERILFDRESLIMAVGSERRLNLSFVPSNATNSGVIWFSSDDQIAVVDSGGTVTAKAIGTVVVYAATEDGQHETECQITVKATANIASLSLEAHDISQVVGEIFMLGYTILPEEASEQELVWESDSPSVVSVNQNGRLEALSPGLARVTVTSKDGMKSDSCVIHVSPEDVATISHVSIEDNTVTVQVISAPNNAILWCAVYREDGKMLGVLLEPFGGQRKHSFICDGTNRNYVKVFLTDENITPLCECVERFF